jgi:hypothetical protein
MQFGRLASCGFVKTAARIWTLKTGLTQQLGQLEQLVQTTSIQLLPIQQTLIEKQKVEEGHLEKCFQGNTC